METLIGSPYTGFHLLLQEPFAYIQTWEKRAQSPKVERQAFTVFSVKEKLYCVTYDMTAAKSIA